MFTFGVILWCLFSRTRTEYGEILGISPHSVRMWENVIMATVHALLFCTQRNKYHHYEKRKNDYFLRLYEKQITENNYFWKTVKLFISNKVSSYRHTNKGNASHRYRKGTVIFCRICTYFNETIGKVKFLNFLKLANITPVFKKGGCTYFKKGCTYSKK